jgi:hypothetical protein
LGTEQKVRYWCCDESRLGLKTLTGRTITLQGVKPYAIVGWPRKNFYLYGVVEPLSGDSFFWEFSHLDSVGFQDFFDLFASNSPDSLNFIQMDNGSFHQSSALKWPDRLIPIFQPANSPELNEVNAAPAVRRRENVNPIEREMGTHQVSTVLATLRQFR